MYNPFWVASARAESRSPMASVNHTCHFGIEEGRARPSEACPHATRHINPLIWPKTVKSAPSQGGAFALDRRDHTHLQTYLKDMKMEFSS